MQLDFVNHQSQYWLIAITVFLASLFIMFLISKLVLKRLISWIQSTETKLDDLLIDKLRAPSKALGFVLSLGIGLQFIPLQYRLHPLVTFAPKVLLILTGVWFLDRCLCLVLQQSSALKNIPDSRRSLFLTILRVLFFSITAIILLDTLGISITPILASLGVGSVAIALALQDTLSNFFSGLYIMLDKPFRIGDFIRLQEGAEGIIRKVGWRSTRVELASNSTIVIPNSKLSTSLVTNFDMPSTKYTFSIPVWVNYSVNLDDVERIALEVTKSVLCKTKGADADSEPKIRITTFGVNSIELNLNVQVLQYRYHALLKHELLKAIHSRFIAEKFIVTLPHQTGVK